MPRRFRSNRFELDDSNRYEDFVSDDFGDDDEEIDPEVKEVFEESQQQGFGTDKVIEKLHNYRNRSPKLSGGDLDAEWEYADIGEESVGGQDPTPDQDMVDEEGEAVGITYRDREPLGTTAKLERRDRNPWELNPESSPDYRKRVREEFGQPLRKFAGQFATKKSSTNRAASKTQRQKSALKQAQTGNAHRRTTRTKTLVHAKAR